MTNANQKSWPLSSIVLGTVGVALAGAGFYFMLLRSPLLSEDLRYMGVPAAQFDAVKPRLEAWLTHVFLVMGGYGHSRLQERILGGVTRAMFESMTVPVLMSH